eukprot:Filipodium_phascolosomae@DN36_c0_g1_i1.p1
MYTRHWRQNLHRPSNLRHFTQPLIIFQISTKSIHGRTITMSTFCLGSNGSCWGKLCCLRTSNLPKKFESVRTDDEQWGFQRFNWMVYGLIQKAKHNSDFHEKIMSDSGIFPVEAAPRDVIWGVGVGKEKVGFAIMEARWHLENTITDQT